MLYDNECSWKRYTKTLDQVFGPHVNVTFEPCDVTKDLADYANMKVQIEHVDLFLLFYVCHETSKLASAQGYQFYKGLARVAKPGAIVVICDVMNRSAEDLQRVVHSMSTVRQLSILPASKGHKAEVVALRFGEQLCDKAASAAPQMMAASRKVEISTKAKANRRK